MAKPRKPVPPPRSRPADLYLSLLLAALTLVLYSPVLHFEFLNFDDPIYVVNNPYVRAGLSWAGLRWAFSTFYAANWFPLTWLSHMADCQWFGLNPGPAHLTAAVLHTVAALLLFAALRRLTGARWPSAFVAFLFAVHPLHVESVAWVAERKDVLCALFWFLALYWYAGYARRPSLARYLLVLAAFALGLLSKSMIVTLPFVLLLLDVGLLGRGWRAPVFLEKVPFVALAAVSSYLTLLAQQHGNAVRSLAVIPFGLRLENAVVSYVVYIIRFFRPSGLAVFYPYNFALPFWQVAASALALAAVTTLALAGARRYPFFTVGWFWYLGTLVPVIGLVQVGAQSSADRYTYVPSVGLSIMLAWGSARLLTRAPLLRTLLAVCALAACALLTSRLLPYWTDSASLFQHAADVTANNYLAHNNLAEYYLDHNQLQLAALHVQAALRIRPAYPEAHANLALVYQRAGRVAEAEREFREAIRLRPDDPALHHALGFLLAGRARLDEALAEFRAETELRPADPAARYTLGSLLLSTGRFDEAAREFSAALRLQPDFPDARAKLALARAGRTR